MKKLLLSIVCTIFLISDGISAGYTKEYTVFDALEEKGCIEGWEKKARKVNEEIERKRETKLLRHYDYNHNNDYTIEVSSYTSRTFKIRSERYIGILTLYIYAHDSCHVWSNFQLQQGTKLYDPNQFLGEIYLKNSSLRPGTIERITIAVPEYLNIDIPITI